MTLRNVIFLSAVYNVIDAKFCLANFIVKILHNKLFTRIAFAFFMHEKQVNNLVGFRLD